MSDLPRNARRVITGFNASGRSAIIADGPSPTTVELSALTSVEAWRVDETPADLSLPDTVTGPVSLNPPRMGAIVRVVHFYPDSAADGDVQVGTEAFGDDEGGDMHTTDSVDVGVVVSGEIWAVMEDGETLLKPGDVLVQRGTPHKWENRSDAVCTTFFVLVGADPATRPV